MSGEDVGRLNVYIVGQDEETSLPWRLAGNQGNEWKIAQVAIDAAQGFKVSIMVTKLALICCCLGFENIVLFSLLLQIKFESVSDDGNNGEINIRDVRLGANPNCTCAPPQACPKLTGEATRPLLAAINHTLIPYMEMFDFTASETTPYKI